MRANRGKTIYYHGGGGNENSFLAHLRQYIMGAKLFSGTTYMRNNITQNVSGNKIEWFPWQPIMLFLRMGTYLQNVHITAVTHPKMLILIPNNPQS